MSTQQDPSDITASRFAQNIVSETTTMLIAIVFGLATSVLIVRGLPKTPIFEFYIYIVVFSWIGILLPICISGLDLALTKHIPEILGRQGLGFRQLIGLALISTLILSSFIVALFSLLSIVFPGLLISIEVTPFFQLALFSLPLTSISMVIQGIFRGIQEMRYVTYVMALYHGFYFILLLGLFFLGSLSLTSVILVNIGVSFVTILIEIIILGKVFRKYHSVELAANPNNHSLRGVASTSIQGLALALLGAIFLNAPLLIANLYRTSDLLLAGLGLAINVSVYIHRGQAAPFRTLLPRASGDAAIGKLDDVKRYVNRSFKLGIMFNGFIFVIVVVFARSILGLLFGEEGLVAVPFLILLSGSFLLYPLINAMMETLIGLGGAHRVVITYGGWTILVLGILWVFGPVGREPFVAILWLLGLPFLYAFVRLYRKRTGLKIEHKYLSRLTAVLLITASFSIALLLVGVVAIQVFNFVGVLLTAFNVLLVLCVFPLFLSYLWLLVWFRSLNAQDLTSLENLSQVLHPLSKPITKYIRYLEKRCTRR